MKTPEEILERLRKKLRIFEEEREEWRGVWFSNFNVPHEIIENDTKVKCIKDLIKFIEGGE